MGALSARVRARIGAVPIEVPKSTLSAPLLYWDAKSQRWVLPYGFMLTDPEFGTIAIPSDFVTDLASVPQAVQSIVPFISLSVVAPLCHDFYYGCGGQGIYTRAEVDRLFLRLMKREGVSAARRTAAYWAVRLFGARSWRAYAPVLEVVL